MTKGRAALVHFPRLALGMTKGTAPLAWKVVAGQKALFIVHVEAGPSVVMRIVHEVNKSIFQKNRTKTAVLRKSAQGLPN
jgi:hypothetical protein